MNNQPIIIDVTKLSDEAFLVLLRLATGNDPHADNPFDENEHRAIIGEAWGRGMLNVSPGAAAEWTRMDGQAGPAEGDS